MLSFVVSAGCEAIVNVLPAKLNTEEHNTGPGIGTKGGHTAWLLPPPVSFLVHLGKQNGFETGRMSRSFISCGCVAQITTNWGSTRRRLFRHHPPLSVPHTQIVKSFRVPLVHVQVEEFAMLGLFDKRYSADRRP